MDATRDLSAALVSDLRRYRGWTEASLARVPDAWVYRRAGWTRCCIGWHMGHLAWKQDAYVATYFGLPARLDADWERRFYGPDPLDPTEGPPLPDLRRAFDDAFSCFLSALGEVRDADLLSGDPAWPDGTRLGAVTNVIFHEGEHCAGIDALRWSFARRELEGDI